MADLRIHMFVEAGASEGTGDVSAIAAARMHRIDARLRALPSHGMSFI